VEPAGILGQVKQVAFTSIIGTSSSDSERHDHPSRSAAYERFAIPRESPKRWSQVPFEMGI
jgi:hypothetical protein